MKKILLVISTIAMNAMNAVGQQHVVTYYDAFNVHKKEVYDLDKDAQNHGKYTAYWEDGTIAEQGTYIHGALNGKYMKYINSDGVRGVSDINNYKMGEFDGLQQTFLSAPMSLPLYKKPKEERFYKNKHVLWVKIYWYPNHDEKKRYLWQWQQYKDGEQVWERGFFPDGKIMYSGNMILEGKYRHYIADSLQDGKPIYPRDPE